MSAIEEIEDLIFRYEGQVTITIASECAWSGELRLVLTDPPEEPSRSMTFYAAGRANPEDVADALLKDATHWLAETGTEPLVVGYWRTGE